MYGIGARIFYSVISRMAGFDMCNSSDFKLLDRKVIDILNKMPERGFFRAISYWVGYNKITVEFDVQERVDGESKWSAPGLIKYALSNISSYSTAPMQTVTVLGVVMLVISGVFGVWALIDKIIGRACFQNGIHFCVQFCCLFLRRHTGALDVAIANHTLIKLIALGRGEIRS